MEILNWRVNFVPLLLMIAYANLVHCKTLGDVKACLHSVAETCHNNCSLMLGDWLRDPIKECVLKQETSIMDEAVACVNRQGLVTVDDATECWRSVQPLPSSLGGGVKRNETSQTSSAGSGVARQGNLDNVRNLVAHYAQCYNSCGAQNRPQMMAKCQADCVALDLSSDLAKSYVACRQDLNSATVDASVVTNLRSIASNTQKCIIAAASRRQR